MRLLVVTQTLDTEDPVLGFFHAWVAALATRFERIIVICLKEGRHALPANVRVYSLGKEKARTRGGWRGARTFRYARRFIALAWRMRHDYDAVFVHMNQEYILLAGWLWKLAGTPVYLWRNHFAGSWITDLAAALCTAVFCTSKHSYTARYAKTEIMPVGVDTSRFTPDPRALRAPRSILFLARMAPSKRPELLLDALALLDESGTNFTADFVGSPAPQDRAYYGALAKRASETANGRVRFLPGVPNRQTPALYRTHEVFVNTSPSGMLDKTIFEALASGAVVLAASEDYAELAGSAYTFDSAETLARRLRETLGKGGMPELAAIPEEHSLEALADRLAAAIAPRAA